MADREGSTKSKTGAKGNIVGDRGEKASHEKGSMLQKGCVPSGEKKKRLGWGATRSVGQQSIKKKWAGLKST